MFQHFLSLLYFVQIVCCGTLVTVNWFCIALVICFFSYVTLFSCPLPKAICHQLKTVNYDYLWRVICLLLNFFLFWSFVYGSKRWQHLFPIPSLTPKHICMH